MERQTKKSPFFSIVIPVFNREKEIQLAIASCLSQSFVDFEVIIVDDGSNDQTVANIKAVLDERVHLIVHPVNCGVCQARNTGIEHSRGEWLLFLDSDEEFLPAIFKEISHAALSASETVGQLGFLYQRDDGHVMPLPVPREKKIYDYEAYISWNDELIYSDFLACTRRSTFHCVKFAQSRAYEDAYLFDFTKLYKLEIFPIVAALYHLDSPNRITGLCGIESVDKICNEAPDQLAAINALLLEHGEIMRQKGPRQFRLYRKIQVLNMFLVGKRSQGFCLSWSYLRAYPMCLQGWIIFIVGLLGPKPLALMKLLKNRC